MKVSIIIINYRTPQLTVDCVNSIRDNCAGMDYEIIVVDNNSGDNSVLYLTEKLPGIKLLKSDVNLGFGQGNNLGVSYASGEFVLLLNSDMLLTENSLKKMLVFFEQNEKLLNIGVLGCKLVDRNGNINNSGGGFPWVKHDLNEIYVILAEKLLKKQFPPRDPYDFNLPYFRIDYVIGADMFMRRSLFEELGGFDAHYFMYYEESDFQMKITKLGHKNYITTCTSIIHFEGASSETNGITISNFKRITIARSRNYYFKMNDRKNYPLHLVTDMLLNFTRLFNRNYTFKENIAFVKENIKSY